MLTGTIPCDICGCHTAQLAPRHLQSSTVRTCSIRLMPFRHPLLETISGRLGGPFCATFWSRVERSDEINYRTRHHESIAAASSAALWLANVISSQRSCETEYNPQRPDISVSGRGLASIILAEASEQSRRRPVARIWKSVAITGSL